MPSISAARWRAYRAETYRLKPGRRLTTPDAAVRFVNERGFVYFWPIKGVELPSLWAAVAGDRPVADAHDDPGHVTWGWKDRLLGQRRWFYAKLLRGKATLVSLPTLPYFYALSENYGAYQHDYEELYAAGRLTQEAKAVYEALLAKGALDTLALRREARLASQDSTTRFERALVDLQSGLFIQPIGVAEVGAWRYAFIYDIVARHHPDLPARAGALKRSDARAHLAGLYLRSVGAATVAQLRRLFRWTPEEARRTAERLVETRRAVAVTEVAGVTGDWLTVPALLRRR